MSRARRFFFIVLGLIVAAAGITQIISDAGATWLGVLLIISAVSLFFTAASSTSKKDY